MTESYSWLGVDVGGTFTDLAFMNTAGQLHCIKVPSTPQAPAQAALQGIEELLETGAMSSADLSRLIHIHGSTVAVNTLIERRGARIGVLVTSGFRDLFEMGRMAIPKPAVFTSRRTRPLAPRRQVAEIAGRLDMNGAELAPVDEADVIAKARALLDMGVEALVVCLLHSYLNPGHELAVREIVTRNFPGITVECSSQIWPQAREFERGVLASINAYIRPAIESYLRELSEGTAAMGIPMEPLVTRSNGGSQRARSVRDNPSVALLSGTASGLVAVAGMAQDLGMSAPDLITLDVGGTSADIGVVRAGTPLLSSEEHVAELPILLPTIAVSSIGAGGGSIVAIDDDGVILVGPKSAGAKPGPACYDRGGTLPTLTDAVVVAGWLPASQPLGGKITVRADLARQAIAPLAARLGRAGEEVAAAAITIATAMMAAEATGVMARRGVDAPNFSLVPFGGAGPLFGALIAEEVHIDKVIVPPHAGALSAVGALRSNIEGDLIEAVYAPLDGELHKRLDPARARLRERAQEWLNGEAGVPHGELSMTFSAEMRYASQSFEISVDLEEEDLAPGAQRQLAEKFHATYEAIYGRAHRNAAVYVKELRAHAMLPLPPRVPMSELSRASSGERRRDEIWLRGKRMEAQFLPRSSMAPGEKIVGPAVISQPDNTTLVPDGWTAEVVSSSALMLERR